VNYYTYHASDSTTFALYFLPRESNTYIQFMDDPKPTLKQEKKVQRAHATTLLSP